MSIVTTVVFLQEYNGLRATALNAEGWHGRIDEIEDLVTFSAEREHDLQMEFESAVDDYRSTCLEIGKTPGLKLTRITPNRSANRSNSGGTVQ